MGAIPTIGSDTILTPGKWLRNEAKVTIESGILIASIGVVKAGAVMAIITASGLYTPYDDDGTDDGTRTAKGFLVEAVDGTVAVNRTCAIVVAHGEIDESELPVTTVGAAGYLDANAKTDLANAGFIYV